MSRYFPEDGEDRRRHTGKRKKFEPSDDLHFQSYFEERREVRVHGDGSSFWAESPPPCHWEPDEWAPPSKKDLKKDKKKDKKDKKKKKKKEDKKSKKKRQRSESSDSDAEAAAPAPVIGPVPSARRAALLPAASGGYGQALLPGEGSAMAQFAKNDMRIPRRGEIGLSVDDIDRFESQGYVMTGSRHKTINAVRQRKESQVLSAQEREEEVHRKTEELAQKEAAIIGSFKEMISKKEKSIKKKK